VKILSSLLLATIMMFLAPIFPAVPIGMPPDHSLETYGRNETIIFKTSNASGIDFNLRPGLPKGCR
jgi:hypothetical protein